MNAPGKSEARGIARELITRSREHQTSTMELNPAATSSMATFTRRSRETRGTPCVEVVSRPRDVEAMSRCRPPRPATWTEQKRAADQSRHVQMGPVAWRCPPDRVSRTHVRGLDCQWPKTAGEPRGRVAGCSNKRHNRGTRCHDTCNRVGSTSWPSSSTAPGCSGWRRRS